MELNGIEIVDADALAVELTMAWLGVTISKKKLHEVEDAYHKAQREYDLIYKMCDVLEDSGLVNKGILRDIFGRPLDNVFAEVDGSGPLPIGDIDNIETMPIEEE